MDKKRVLIANLSPGTVRTEFMRSLFSMIMHDINNEHLIHSFVPRYAGPCLGIYRNMACDHFLTTDADRILFIDSDIELRDHTLADMDRVMNEEGIPVLSGLYMMALEEGMRPSIFHKKLQDDGHWHMVADETFEDNTLVEVDGCGAGLLMIDRWLLEAMFERFGKPRPWFGEDVFDGVIYGEDFFFCEKVKAMGEKVYVHTGIDVGHHKNVCLSADMFKNYDVVVPEEKRAVA